VDSSKTIDQTLKEIESLISLPEIYLKYRELMEDPDSTNEAFSDVVGSDPNLAAIVLKIVNSPLYGYSGGVDSINRAIHYIGINQVHDLVLASSAMALEIPNEIVPLKTFWRSSLFSGVFARLLGYELKMTGSECLFVIGLLHQIGSLVIYAKYSEQARQTIALAKESHETIDKAEMSILDFNYAQVGAKLMAQWRLPPKFQVITYFHPTPTDAPTYLKETSLLHLVHGYVYQQSLGTDLSIEQLVHPEVWGILNVTAERLQIVLEEAKQVSADIEKFILK
jgi:HD-like signal output (HDOD) protein